MSLSKSGPAWQPNKNMYSNSTLNRLNMHEITSFWHQVHAPWFCKINWHMVHTIDVTFTVRKWQPAHVCIWNTNIWTCWSLKNTYLYCIAFHNNLLITLFNNLNIYSFISLLTVLYYSVFVIVISQLNCTELYQIEWNFSHSVTEDTNYTLVSYFSDIYFKTKIAFKKGISKCCLQDGGHFVSASRPQ